MLYRHQDKTLARINGDLRFNGGFDRALVRAFRKRMQIISHQGSMRLNDQFRLILKIEKTDHGNRLVVIGIEDYH